MPLSRLSVYLYIYICVLSHLTQCTLLVRILFAQCHIAIFVTFVAKSAKCRWDVYIVMKYNSLAMYKLVKMNVVLEYNTTLTDK